jgi:hypothetical protein
MLALKSRFRALAAAPLALFTGVLACGSPAESSASSTESVVAPARATLARPTPVPAGVVGGTYPGAGIPKYNNGPLLTGTIPVIPIFYGTAWQPNYQSTILSYLSTMSGTSYWQVVQEYADTHGQHPGAIAVQPAVYFTSYSYGRNLNDSLVEEIAQDAARPLGSANTNNIFLVFTADDVGVVNSPPPVGIGTLCHDFLGWHMQANAFSWTVDVHTAGPYTAQFALVGSPQFCINNPQLSSSSPITGPSPWDSSVNGAAIDEAITTAEHEIAEAATDPDTETGVQPEIGDICAWVAGPVATVKFTFGEYDLGNGAPYSAGLAGFDSNLGSKYLVQTIWDTKQNACAYGPASLDCASAAGACGTQECGTAPNGCGGTVSCGTCPLLLTCQSGACVRRVFPRVQGVSPEE